MADLPKKGDRVELIYPSCFNLPLTLTVGKIYEVQEDVKQGVWYHSNGIPFYPSLKVNLLNDNGELVYLNLCRFKKSKES